MEPLVHDRCIASESASVRALSSGSSARSSILRRPFGFSRLERRSPKSSLALVVAKPAFSAAAFLLLVAAVEARLNFVRKRTNRRGGLYAGAARLVRVDALSVHA